MAEINSDKLNSLVGKMLADRDPGLRQVAAWALARTGDLVDPVVVVAFGGWNDPPPPR